MGIQRSQEKMHTVLHKVAVHGRIPTYSTQPVRLTDSLLLPRMVFSLGRILPRILTVDLYVYVALGRILPSVN